MAEDLMVILSRIVERLDRIEKKIDELSNTVNRGGKLVRVNSGNFGGSLSGEEKKRIKEKALVQTSQLRRMGELLNDRSLIDLANSLSENMNKKGYLTGKQWGLLRYKRKDTVLKIIGILVNSPSVSESDKRKLLSISRDLQNSKSASESVVREVLDIVRRYENE